MLKFRKGGSFFVILIIVAICCAAGYFGIKFFGVHTLDSAMGKKTNMVNPKQEYKIDSEGNANNRGLPKLNLMQK